MLEGCISGSIHFVMMVKEDEGQDSEIVHDSWTMRVRLETG